MANPYQQQVLRRKLLYGGLIIALFTGAWLWRTRLVDAQARDLKIREEARGEVELASAAARVATFNLQGLLTCYLWSTANELQKKNRWSELELQVDWLTRLQPHFLTPWLFQSWNLSYNVSVESDRPGDKYYYIAKGIKLLARGERQNANHPDLRWSIGFYTQHKICMSDDTNYQRSLLQLSLIPPHDRDPARFWKKNALSEPEFNYEEFAKFCEDHPQLIRRLRIGMHKDSEREKKRLFVCNKPEEVVAFLQDNYLIPSIYEKPTSIGEQPWNRGWLEKPAQADKLLDPLERFPVLPPQHPQGFDTAALDDQSIQDLQQTKNTAQIDAIDGYTVAEAWYAYAQEPIPKPGELPGSSEDITDPVTQRKPRNMTTLIFRSYPAQGRRFTAERLQQEGWFDDEGWDIRDWFEFSDWYAQSKSEELRNKLAKVGSGKNWSLDAWTMSRDAWQKHGDANHLLYPTGAAQANMERLAKAFHDNPKHKQERIGPAFKYDKNKYADKKEQDEFFAAQYIEELKFYRQVSNFMHHYYRSKAEADPDTVLARKLFYKAENQLYREGDKVAALSTYETPVQESTPGVKSWSNGKALTPLQAWLTLVLRPEPKVQGDDKEAREVFRKDREAFRRDDFIQEQTAEVQLRYLTLVNTMRGGKLREQTAGVMAATPSAPVQLMTSLNLLDTVRGPFDVLMKDADGQFLPPNIDESILRRVMERMHMTPPPPQK
jgi:hypothetical protein